MVWSNAFAMICIVVVEGFVVFRRLLISDTWHFLAIRELST